MQSTHSVQRKAHSGTVHRDSKRFPLVKGNQRDLQGSGWPSRQGSGGHSGPEISPQGAPNSWLLEPWAGFGSGNPEPGLLFLTTACGHTRAAFQLALAWDATPSHLAIWKGFSSSLFLLECFHDPQAWKHLLTTSPGNKRSSQDTRTHPGQESHTSKLR